MDSANPGILEVHDRADGAAVNEDVDRRKVAMDEADRAAAQPPRQLGDPRLDPPGVVPGEGRGHMGQVPVGRGGEPSG